MQKRSTSIQSMTISTSKTAKLTSVIYGNGTKLQILNIDYSESILNEGFEEYLEAWEKKLKKKQGKGFRFFPGCRAYFEDMKRILHMHI